MENFSIQFYLALQLIIISVLSLIMFFIVKKLKTTIQADLQVKLQAEASNEIVRIFEPILKQAEATSQTFEKQIKEKRAIVHNLNEKLDDKIINLNLVLKRAKEYLNIKSGSSAEPKDPSKEIEPDLVYKQQEAIFKLYKEGKDSKTISKSLSIPQGEIDLIIGLKNKLIELSQKKKVVLVKKPAVA